MNIKYNKQRQEQAVDKGKQFNKIPVLKAATRALIALALLGGISIILIASLGRPDSVAFTSSFKCHRLAPGFSLNLPFGDCDGIEFSQGTIVVPSKGYIQDDDQSDDVDVERIKKNINIKVEGNRLITATIDNNSDYQSDVAVSTGADAIFEIASAPDATIFSFKVSGKQLDALIHSLGVELSTYSDGDFEGFNDGKDRLFDKISVNRHRETQGNVPPEIEVAILGMRGGAYIYSTGQKITGWQPISLFADSSQKSIKLTSSQLQSKQVSSLALTIDSNPVDIGTKFEELQIDYLNASINKLVLHQDIQDKYIEVSFSGNAEGIKLDSKEMIEPVISELISSPSYKTGITGLLFFFLVSAAGMFLKRSLEILSEAWLPKDDPNTKK